VYNTTQKKTAHTAVQTPKHFHININGIFKHTSTARRYVKCQCAVTMTLLLHWICCLSWLNFNLWIRGRRLASRCRSGLVWGCVGGAGGGSYS